ncbi:MAG: twin-arginine translocase TatA/TatE family subunit [Anaerolineales bacterium]|jgi:TatA/E family protein of Tat protein translocase
MPFGIQPIHIVIIILVAFLIFGANRLPELGRSLGKTITEFRKGTREAAEGFKEEIQKDAPASAAPGVIATPVTPAVATPSNFPAASAQSAIPPSAQPLQPAGNFCIQCGNPNPSEARFCASCGAKLPEKVA